MLIKFYIHNSEVNNFLDGKKVGFTTTPTEDYIELQHDTDDVKITPEKGTCRYYIELLDKSFMFSMIAIQEKLLKTKKQIELDLTDNETMTSFLFNGKQFDKEIYNNFTIEERKYYSQLIQIKNNLKGQLDVFKRLKGEEDTEFNKIKRWMNNVD